MKLEVNKITSIIADINTLENNHNRLRGVMENYENHYATIANYMEKYLPVTV